MLENSWNLATVLTTPDCSIEQLSICRALHVRGMQVLRQTIRYEMLGLVENISETSVIRVAEKQECDPNCHRGSGCSERGEGKCDSYCVTGFGLDSNTYTCMGECDLVARCCSFVDELPSLMNETKPEQILVLFQFYSSLCAPLDSTGWAKM